MCLSNANDLVLVLAPISYLLQFVKSAQHYKRMEVTYHHKPLECYLVKQLKNIRQSIITEKAVVKGI